MRRNNDGKGNGLKTISKGRTWPPNNKNENDWCCDTHKQGWLMPDEELKTGGGDLSDTITLSGFSKSTGLSTHMIALEPPTK